MSIWHKWVMQGVTDAARALGRRNDAIDIGSLAVVLKYAWLHSIGAANPDRTVAGRPPIPLLIPGGEREMLVAHALELLALVPARILRNELLSDSYWTRLQSLVYEHQISERTAPELLIFPDGTAPEWTTALPERPIFVVFDQQVNFTNEFYTLAIDALVAASDRVRPSTSPLIGVHTSWLSASYAARRGILCARQGHMLAEVPLAGIQPKAVLVLCTTSRIHQTLFEKATIPDVVWLNPYPNVSEVLDNKLECAERWHSAGISTPRCLLLGLEQVGALRDWLRIFANEVGEKLVIQPNHGTESLLVRVFDVSKTDTWKDVEHHVRTILSGGDEAIARPYVYGLEIGTADGSSSAFDLRINVQYDGIGHVAESGFIQVADKESGIASSTTGSIMRLSRAGIGGFRDPGRALPITLDHEDWKQIRVFAEMAAQTLPPVASLGIDIRLTRGKDGSLLPVALDANPRPAGYTHSEFLSSSDFAGQPGVTMHLWNDARLKAVTSRDYD